MSSAQDTKQILDKVDAIRKNTGQQFRDQIVTTMYDQAEAITNDVVTRSGKRWTFDATLDYVATHPILGLPFMLGLLALTFYLTIAGANIPSAFLAGLLMEQGGLVGFFEEFGIAIPAYLHYSVYDLLHLATASWMPASLASFFIDGIYLCLGWVISVMLPPMAIFFPIFTLLEDLGYLPRIAFNLDWLFQKSGAHGKQALTMCMGFGCNAAGVTACRIIDSPREKLIAILTNNFMICNGRFPTVIAVALFFSYFLGYSDALVSFTAASIVIGIVLLGVVFTFVTSLILSRTFLKGEASAYTLELPPYRRPAVMRIIYTSLIDRTMFILARACVVAIPAGAAIWICANVNIGDASIATHIENFLQPLGYLMGLDGAILLAYIIAIPANEIVVPTIIMLYIRHNTMIEFEGDMLRKTFLDNGWSLLTAVSLLLFCLLHNPCGTTIWTIYKETRSKKWTIFGSIFPVVLGIVVCIIVAGVWRLIAN
ncbi:Ferrous iron transport protein B [Poriferisphaera corsica]|uniref:Ferrous iron transport protein B n=1 Tax=Poriferisphaera corsica TaxID=2528020 RepID=A0A517YPU3_9BACT|nr:nucleoside recognition domain-containing protein [Poriferisphaera corsica]QDU32243.1 Ferrous iron transport protein B [Poriferisphaera corsica]